MKINRQDVADAAGLVVQGTLLVLLVLGCIIAAAAAITGVVWAEVTSTSWAFHEFGGWVGLFASLLWVIVDVLVFVIASEEL